MKLCSYHISLELFLHPVFLATVDFRAVLPVLLMDIKVSCRGPVKSDVAVSAVVRACSCAYVRMSGGELEAGLQSKSLQTVIFMLFVVLPKSQTKLHSHHQPKLIFLATLHTTLCQSFSFRPT